MPKPEDYSEKKMELGGWPVNIVSFRLGDTYRTTIDNTDPGAWVVKAEGATKEEAELYAKTIRNIDPSINSTLVTLNN